MGSTTGNAWPAPADIDVDFGTKPEILEIKPGLDGKAGALHKAPRVGKFEGIEIHARTVDLHIDAMTSAMTQGLFKASGDQSRADMGIDSCSGDIFAPGSAFRYKSDRRVTGDHQRSKGFLDLFGQLGTEHAEPGNICVYRTWLPETGPEVKLDYLAFDKGLVDLGSGRKMGIVRVNSRGYYGGWSVIMPISSKRPRIQP